MIKKLLIFLSIIFLAFFAAFAQDTSQNSYFPLVKGNFWIYKLSTLSQIRYEATGTEDIDGKTYLVLSSHPSQDYENIQKEYYFTDKDGIYYFGKKLKNLNAIYTPLLKEIPVNFENPQSWEWKGTVSGIKTKITVKTAGPEKYTFAGRDFKSFKVIQSVIEETQKDPAKKIVITKWYVKGIGKVKEVDEIFMGKEHYALTAELESFGTK